MRALLLLLFISGATLPVAAQQADQMARLAALCPAPTQPDRKELMKLEEKLLDTLQHQRTAPLWNALGCTRIQLAVSGAKPPGKRTVYAMAGNLGWLEGAINALILGAELEASAVAIRRLALAGSLSLSATPSPSWLTIDRLADLVFTHVALAGDWDADIKAACPRLLLAVSDTASAHECLRLTRETPILPVVSQLTSSIQLHVQYFRLWEPELLIPQALVTYWYSFEGKSNSRFFKGRSVFETAAEMVAPPCSPPGGRSLGNEQENDICKRDENFDDLPSQDVFLVMWDDASRRWDRQYRSAPVRPTAMWNNTEFTIAAHGYLRFDSSIEASAWSIGIRLEKAGTGGRASADKLAPLSQNALHLSDVVVGTVLSGLKVPVGPDSVWLAPDGRIPRDSALHLYVQVRSEAPLPQAVTRFRIFEKGKEPGSKGNSISIDANTPISAGHTSVQKVLGVSNLKPGRYEIEVEVRDPVSGRVAIQRAGFELVK